MLQGRIGKEGWHAAPQHGMRTDDVHAKVALLSLKGMIARCIDYSMHWLAGCGTRITLKEDGRKAWTQVAGRLWLFECHSNFGGLWREGRSTIYTGIAARCNKLQRSTCDSFIYCCGNRCIGIERLRLLG